MDLFRHIGRLIGDALSDMAKYVPVLAALFFLFVLVSAWAIDTRAGVIVTLIYATIIVASHKP